MFSTTLSFCSELINRKLPEVIRQWWSLLKENFHGERRRRRSQVLKMLSQEWLIDSSSHQPRPIHICLGLPETAMVIWNTPLSPFSCLVNSTQNHRIMKKSLSVILLGFFYIMHSSTLRIFKKLFWPNLLKYYLI